MPKFFSLQPAQHPSKMRLGIANNADSAGRIMDDLTWEEFQDLHNFLDGRLSERERMQRERRPEGRSGLFDEYDVCLEVID